MTEINVNSPLHNINPPTTGVNLPPENGNLVNPTNSDAPAPEQNVAQKGTEAKSLSLKLDSMMIRAAQMATRSVDVDALADAVKDAPLDDAVRTALEDAAARAETALPDLAGASGRQIAEALVTDDKGNFDWGADNETATALKEAIDAQAELSEMLHKLVNNPSISGDVSDQLTEMAFQCDRRQSEIMTLAMQLADAVQAAGDNKELNARLDKKLSELLPRQALSMHGNEAALEKMKAQLQPLADRMEAFAAKPNASVTSEEYAALKMEVTEAAAAVARAAKEGFPTEDGGRIMPDRTFLESAEKLIRFAEKQLNDTRKTIGLGSVKAFADSTFGISSKYEELLGKEELPYLEEKAPNLAKAASIRYQIHELALQYMENNSPDIKSQMLGLANDMAKIKPSDIKNEIEFFSNRLGRRSRITLKDLRELAVDFSRTFGLFSQVSHFTLMLEQVNKKLTPEQFLSTSSARALMEGELAFSTLVEARIHGMEDADVDPTLDDSRMVSSEPLGTGVVSTVSLVTYKDGSEWVFKPEAPGRQGMEHLSLAADYKPWQQLAQLNLLTYNVAKSLGMDDLVPKCTVGSHKSKYGTFMKKAPGLVGADFADGKKVNGLLTPKDINKLPPDQYGLVMGRILRELNRLEWLDKLTGQGDRHILNYLIEVKEDLSVTVTGIDNDMCFPAFHTGLATYNLSPNHAAYFEKMKQDIVKAYPLELQEEAQKRLDADPGVKKLSDNGLEIDVQKIEAGELHTALRRTLGLRKPAIPDYIDEDAYKNIMALKEGEKRAEYIANLKKTLPKNAANAAISRLDETIAHAEKLAAEGNVIKEEDFARQDVQNKLLAKELHTPHPVKPLGPDNFQLEERIAFEAQEQMQSIFRRDLFKALERPGWFA